MITNTRPDDIGVHPEWLTGSMSGASHQVTTPPKVDSVAKVNPAAAVDPVAEVDHVAKVDPVAKVDHVAKVDPVAKVEGFTAASGSAPAGLTECFHTKC